ncbi:MAG: acetyl-CoA carboxylase biotin carboxyl carrier protein subunit [Anaerocolumna sp.]|jgi:acetyl-CoA carboxylase biotin carboxyl carrier protein|nr:acetyl-CoA carboxylase biotin carboxyl carrier protein subunit [Anaerocolumna sp.]
MYEIKNAFADISKIIKQCEQSELVSFVYRDSILSIQFSKVVSEVNSNYEKKKELNEFYKNIKFDDISVSLENDLDSYREKTVEEKTIEEKSVEEKTIDILSPFVGTVVFSSQIKKADGEVTIKKGDVICTIEAMKIYNDIKAPYTGRIVQILVEDYTLVEFEQPIFKIRVDKDE